MKDKEMKLEDVKAPQKKNPRAFSLSLWEMNICDETRVGDTVSKNPGFMFSLHCDVVKRLRNWGSHKLTLSNFVKKLRLRFLPYDPSFLESQAEK